MRRWMLAALAAASLMAASAAAQGKLDQIVERLDLRDVPMSDALRILAEESGVNLVASEEAAKKNVTAFVQNVSVRQAIESIVKAYGLWYREDESSGTVRILTAREFERDLATFRDEETSVFTLYYPNSLDLAYAIRNLYGDRVRLSVDREYQNDEYDEISQRFQRFDLLEQRAQTVNGSSNGANGSSYNSGSFLNGGLFGNQNRSQSYNQQPAYSQPQRSDAQALDRQRPDLTPDQIEALEKSSQAGGTADSSLYDRARGDKTSIFVTVIRRNNMIAVRSSDRAAIREIDKLIKALDVPTPQVLLEVQILSLDLGDDFESAFDATYSDQHVSSSLGDRSPAGGAFAVSGGFFYQYVNDKFQARLAFLQDRKRVNTVATPVLLVANNEVARLFIGEERPLVRNISSQTLQNTGSTVTSPNTTIEMRPVGTTLLLTPNVNADRTVTLRVLQENSDINHNGASIPIVTGNGTVTNQPIDTVKSRTVTGTVVAKDGLTLALGGLIEESLTNQQTGVPGLMDLPLLGVLFRSESKIRSHKELVVLIRPYVLFTASEGQQMSRDLAGRLSLHPAGTSMDPMGTYDAKEVPRPPLGRQPLKELLKLQSGLPDGG